MGVLYLWVSLSSSCFLSFTGLLRRRVEIFRKLGMKGFKIFGFGVIGDFFLGDELLESES